MKNSAVVFYNIGNCVQKVICLQAPNVMARAEAAKLSVLFDLLLCLVDDGEVFHRHFRGVVFEISATGQYCFENVIRKLPCHKEESKLPKVVTVIVHVIIPRLERG